MALLKIIMLRAVMCISYELRDVNYHFEHIKNEFQPPLVTFQFYYLEHEYAKSSGKDGG